MKKSSVIEVLLIFMLVLIGIVSTLLMMFNGARIYQNIYDETQIIDEIRLPLAYVKNQILMSEESAIVYIDDVKCLKLNNNEFSTYIFIKDGNIMELLSYKDKVNLKLASTIMSASDLQFDINNDICNLQVFVDGELHQLDVRLKA